MVNFYGKYMDASWVIAPNNQLSTSWLRSFWVYINQPNPCWELTHTYCYRSWQSEKIWGKNWCSQAVPSGYSVTVRPWKNGGCKTMYFPIGFRKLLRGFWCFVKLQVGTALVDSVIFSLEIWRKNNSPAEGWTTQISLSLSLSNFQFMMGELFP